MEHQKKKKRKLHMRLNHDTKGHITTFCSMVSIPSTNSEKKEVNEQANKCG